jgi:hypothetical protein
MDIIWQNNFATTFSCRIMQFCTKFWRKNTQLNTIGITHRIEQLHQLPLTIPKGKQLHKPDGFQR